MISEAYIREELKQVKDPEIPTISIVDLGIVTGIDINDKNVHVTLTPTFAGCPALRLMEDMVVNHLNANSKLGEITVETDAGMVIMNQAFQATATVHGMRKPTPPYY